MIGGAGDDAIKTGKGRDVLRGDDGNDFLFSGAGSDKIFAGEGDDVAYGGKGNDRIFGGDGDDALFGGKGHDRIFDGDGDDLLNGGRGNDKLFAHFGNDELIGGKGNDRLMVRADGGEPIIAHDPDAPLYYPDHPLDDADDTLDGGAGADTFFFRLDIDATEEIARKHSDENGVIDWQAVAGENNALHDHWVNGTGDDWIKDFDRSEGDRIVIKGHTVTAGVEQIDVDDDGVADYSLITLTSNQGGNGGAHDQDALGTIRVDGDLITEADLKVDRMVFFGAHETIDDLTLA